ncbi:MAG: hypothetical protein ICV78_10385 [Tolypothrix sp. Co-bin9]|nr:hypothetical protein [Tolypothrix sp. Co-bin9]
MHNQVESLIQGTSNLENNLKASIADLAQGNTDVQLEKLQILIDKLQGFETVKTQIENLVQVTSNLENRFTSSQEPNRPKSKGFKKSTLGID